MLTGSTDTEVRVWKIGKTKRGSAAVDCVYRLIGHEAAVTCVRFGQMEVLSGDVKGRIFIWWMKTGQVLRRCQVHSSPVKCIQFDSIHIVSGGADHSVCITDIATGEVSSATSSRFLAVPKLTPLHVPFISQVMQTLRGHTMGVIALAFDSERIISVSGDNTVRYWQWGQQTPPSDKLHVLDKGETLLSVAKRYSITVDELMRWNGVTDARQCFAGMTLIVRKADPDKLTDAEKLLLQKEKRAEGGARLAEKVGKDTAATDAMLQEGAKLFKYDRVHKIATDIDFFSLGNRLFGAQKRQLELFPDTVDPNVDTRNLAGRLKADEDRKREEARAADKGISDFARVPEQSTDNDEDAAALAWALKTGSKVRPRYFLSADNEDEWGAVAEGLAVTMLQMLVEYEAYDVVMEQKRRLRSKQSVIGRINTRQLQLEEEKRSAASTTATTAAAQVGADRAVLVHGGDEIVPSSIEPVRTSSSSGALPGDADVATVGVLPVLPVLVLGGHKPSGDNDSRPPSREEKARARREQKAAELARRKEAIKRSVAAGAAGKGGRTKSRSPERGGAQAVGPAGPGADASNDVVEAPWPRSKGRSKGQHAEDGEAGPGGAESALRLPPIPGASR
jgi:murein DD-endopeptidase MepM/ murein hydrolase activator NlpD